MKKKLSESNPPMEVVEVTSVAMLEAACREPMVCTFQYLGKVWRVPGRLLTPEEQDRVDLILEKALPDLLAAADGATRYDLRNSEYLAAKQKYKALAQALALYLAYPMFGTEEKVKAALGKTTANRIYLINYYCCL